MTTHAESMEAITSEFLVYPGLEDVTYTELFERYANSHLGEHHAAQEPRYTKGYGYDASLMLKDLGPDVHPVDHGRHTHDELVIPLLYTQTVLEEGQKFEQFSIEQIVAIRLAAYLHDIGENEHPELLEEVGKVVGDVDYHQKTQQHESDEAELRAYIRALLFPDIPDPLWDHIERIIMKKGDDLEVVAFALCEHSGYYTTGLRAGYLALLENAHRQHGSPKRDDHSHTQLSRLGLEVSSHHRTGTIPELTQRFAYGGLLMQQTAERYLHIQADLKT